MLTDCRAGLVSAVFEHVAGGDLAQRMSSMRRNGESFEPPVVAWMMREMLSGLAYLHGQRVMHRDLKADNFLLDGGQVKIADFGLSRVYKRGEEALRRTNSENPGTCSHLQPDPRPLALTLTLTLLLL